MYLTIYTYVRVFVDSRIITALGGAALRKWNVALKCSKSHQVVLLSNTSILVGTYWKHNTILIFVSMYKLDVDDEYLKIFVTTSYPYLLVYLRAYTYEYFVRYSRYTVHTTYGQVYCYSYSRYQRARSVIHVPTCTYLIFFPFLFFAGILVILLLCFPRRAGSSSTHELSRPTYLTCTCRRYVPTRIIIPRMQRFFTLFWRSEDGQ